MARIEGGWGLTYWQKDTLVGSSQDDEIYANGGDDYAHGGDGDDLIRLGEGNDTGKGGEGNDTIHGEDGNDSIDGGGDQDSLSGGNGDDTVLGGSGHDTIDGGAGSDSLDGGSGNDVLDGGKGNDTMLGGSGDDVFEDFFGANTMVGGEHVLNRDHDIADYSGLYGRVVINLQTQTATTFERISQGGVEHFNQIGSAVVLEIEDVTGTNYNDSITGDGEANILIGLRGDDTLRGGGGDDEIRGGRGEDKLFGDANNDQLFGNEENDTLDGGAGADTLDGGVGNDVLSGGTGNDVFVDAFGNDTIAGGEDLLGFDVDTLDYSALNSGFVEVDLQAGTATTTQVQFRSSTFSIFGQIGSATVSEIENVIGTAGNDTITGDAGRNVLEGGSGSDDLKGGGDDDVLIGGRGFDVLDGGSGRDAYVVDSRYENVGIEFQARDVLRNFNTADDTVHLDNAIYTGLGAEGRLSADAFFDSNSFFPIAQDANDRIILAGSDLYYDADGTGVAEPLLIARFDRLVGTITADDFLII